MRAFAFSLACLLLVSEPSNAQDLDGERLSLLHCGRCHVIGEANKYGGIGMTPSFPVLRAYPDWKDRFAAFHTQPPHKAVTQIEGVTEPFHESLPPSAHPVLLTESEVAAIMAFVKAMEPKDIWAGAPRN
jgi:hypothetical protein